MFFLDDEDRALVDRHRGEHMKAGFALRLVTVRWLGTFLEDPLEVPGAVLDFVAGQLGVADPSQVKRYTERTKTRFDHQWEIRRACRLREFADWVAARSWTSGDGPKAIFLDGMAWLRERKVLLPGVTTLARLVAKVRADVVNGPWRWLVFGHPAHADGAVNRHAYAFCVLEQFWRHLERREIYAAASTKWRNPQAHLLEGKAWQAIRADVLTTLSLQENPDVLLAEHARTLDAAYREVAGRLAVNTEVRVDDAGKIHLTGVKAVEEPPSPVDLRSRTTAMLPRVDLPEVVLEVMSWVPGLAGAFTAVSGGRSRLEDLPTSIAACLAAISCRSTKISTSLEASLRASSATQPNNRIMSR